MDAGLLPVRLCPATKSSPRLLAGGLKLLELSLGRSESPAGADVSRW